MMKESPVKRTRRYTTRWTVHAMDRVSALFITVGGIGTILAVSAVFLFLLVVVVPLFMPGSAKNAGVVRMDTRTQPLRVAVDEYNVMGWTLFRDGTLRVFRLDTGALLASQPIVNGDSLTAWSVPPWGESVAFGFRDGSVRLGAIRFETDYPDESTMPDVAEGELVTVGDAVVERTPTGQLRRQRLTATMSSPIIEVGEAEITMLDHVQRESGSFVCFLTSDGRLFFERVEEIENLMTGEVSLETSGGDVMTAHAGGAGAGEGPSRLLLSETGTSAFLMWEDGRLERYDAREIEAPVLAGNADLLSGRDGRLTAMVPLIGRSTMIVGDDAGNVAAWFGYRDDRGGLELVRGHEYEEKGAAITSMAPSPRSRLFAVGTADGAVRVYQATSEGRVVETRLDAGGPVSALAISAKNDALLAITPDGLHRLDLNVGHPEVTLSALFRPVWYEGYPAPAQVWQSSGGTDDFEPKLGMWPLVFGTLKATFYSMLFGIPLALLAAIFTSEFMSSTIRPRVKTLIESMASLPSVVLGFLAALVIAPFVQRVVPTTMIAFVTIPVTFLLGAYTWQLLPYNITLRIQRLRLPFLLLLLPLGVAIAALMGPQVERVLFAGDMALWLDGQAGSGWGGWIMLLLPLSAFACVLLVTRFSDRRVRDYAARATRLQVVRVDIARFAIIGVGSLALAALAGGVLTGLGADPRGNGSFIGTYVQRNALIVGFVMGFAIIPIIYTIAEDALSAVPDHLRAASLGAGATPWQTAVRIVLPTAMSGLFSAIMIGLGRAVGETMIVLMAAGNTPVLDMNLFNGFRTLSANIAVELPEAVRNSSHYRTLFLAALLLFMMTFSINTVAELVRLRFRKRSSQL